MEWIRIDEIMRLADCKPARARAIKRFAFEKMKKDGCIIVDKKKVPKHIILEILGEKKENNENNS